MLRFPPPLTPRSFLEQYWQKKPLFIPGGSPATQPALTADELAWLATQPDVEARLVLTEHGARGTRYRVQNGPFGERRLRGLPTENWTLLVHDVDKHLPEFRAWFELAPFVPDWRIDDLMVSVAAPGGSVGPHRDQYDVFLCQGPGTRRWHLAEPDEAIPARRRGALALLEPFVSAEPITAGASDVLYLPPAVPHWGIAADTCVTYSLGMRAPTRRELEDALRRSGGTDQDIDPSFFAEAADTFYSDPDLRPDEAEPGLIAERALDRAARLLAGSSAERVSIARALGTLVTTPKDALVPEAPDEDEIDAQTMQAARGIDLRVHGMARLAWCRTNRGHALVFANGRERTVDTGLLVEFRHLCAARGFPALRCAELSRNGAGEAFLRWLIASGTFDPAGAEV